MLHYAPFQDFFCAFEKYEEKCTVNHMLQELNLKKIGWKYEICIKLCKNQEDVQKD